MSTEQAKALIERVTTDGVFRTRLESAPDEEKRAVLRAHGYGDVRLRHLATAMPDDAGGDLTEEEIEARSGGVTGEPVAGTRTTVAFGGLVAVTFP